MFSCILNCALIFLHSQFGAENGSFHLYFCLLPLTQLIDFNDMDSFVATNIVQFIDVLFNFLSVKLIRQVLKHVVHNLCEY